MYTIDIISRGDGLSRVRPKLHFRMTEGTAVALLFTYLYTEAGRRFKPEPAGGSAGTPVPKAA